MATGTGHSLVYAPGIQCRVVEAGDKTASCLMAILTCIRGRRVCRAFADGLRRIALDVTAHALLRLDGWILVVDRCSFREITRRRVTGIAIPAVRIRRVMRRRYRRGIERGAINRVVVQTAVAVIAPSRVGRMNRIYKRTRVGEATLV